MRKIMISLAPVPSDRAIDADRLAEDVMKSVEEGASMCHLHSRLENGELSSDISFMETCFEKILEKVDVVVQASTGGISDMDIIQRCYPLDYQKVETASLNGGSTNLGEAIYINSFEDIRYCAIKVFEKNILPEIEVFDIGMINNIESVKAEVPFQKPLLFNLVFGHKGGMQATIESLIAFRSMVPKDALWGVTHYGRNNWWFLSAAIAMGASLVRIGFEDSKFISNELSAVHKYELVARLRLVIQAMGLEVASVSDTRVLLGL